MSVAYLNYSSVKTRFNYKQVDHKRRERACSTMCLVVLLTVVQMG